METPFPPPKDLRKLLTEKTHVYIDYANTRRSCERLGWRIDLEKLRDLLDSLGTVLSKKFYFGTMVGDSASEGFMKRVRRIGFEVKTKPVKLMRLSINASSISEQSTDILKSFVDETLLRSLKVEAIQYLNRQLRDLNRQGNLFLEKRKCNFDVEIATDMRLDNALGRAKTFCLWSGDSDFADPLLQLLNEGKKVVVVARSVASEINDLRPDGLVIYDLRKLRQTLSMWKAKGASIKKPPSQESLVLRPKIMYHTRGSVYKLARKHLVKPSLAGGGSFPKRLRLDSARAQSHSHGVHATHFRCDREAVNSRKGALLCRIFCIKLRIPRKPGRV